MKLLIDKIREDKFLTNSLIFFIGSFLVGVGNYLYHFLTARMLTVEVYGELQSLLAILAVTGVLTGAISTVLTKYTADFKAKNWPNKIYTLFLLFTKKILTVTVIFFIFFLILSGYIAKFLNLTSILPLMILGTAFLFGFLGSINAGVLRGLQKFKELSVVSIIPVFLKILFAILLVKLGFALNGAVGAVVLAGLIGYLISFYPLKFLFKQQKEGIETKEIFRYSFPVFFTLLFTTLLYSLDIILVKHFFSAQTAGEYGALAMLGRIIFFITAPIVGVMFPMAANAHGNHTDPTKVFKKTIFLVGLIGFVILLSYFFLPDFIIKILIGSKFLSISKFLGWFGLSMFLYSLVGLFAQYFLSIERVKGAYLVGVGVALQAILISIFHTNLWQIIWTMNGVMFFILALSIFYYFRIIMKKCPKN